VSELAAFLIPLVTDHFGDKSVQAVNYTDADNQVNSNKKKIH